MILRRLQAEGFKHLRGIDLVFPPKGTFLIQGNNEAGKSSLFEVVYFCLFGKGLQARASEDLIGYGLNEAKVYVELELPKGDLKIERVIRRNKTNTVKVVVGEEVITTSREANRRIQQEINLDPDTLLNSCFVEQKALEKLEGLDKSSRESAVMKLLNLDRIQAIEEELKVKKEDERLLEEWKKKMRVAEIRERKPHLQVEVEKYETLKRFWEVKEKLAEAEKNRRIADEEEKKIPIFEKARNELQAKVQDLHKIRDREHKIDNILHYIRLISEKEAHLYNINKQIEAIEKEKANLPILQNKLHKAYTLLRLLSRLETLKNRINDFAKWLDIDKKIGEEESRVEILNAELEAKNGELENRKKNIELLSKWREVKEKEEKLIEKEKLSEEEGRNKNQAIIGFALSFILAIVLLLSPFKWFALITILPLLFSARSYKKMMDARLGKAQIEGALKGIDISHLKNLRHELERENLGGLEEIGTINEKLAEEENIVRLLENEIEKLKRTINQIQGRKEELSRQLEQVFPTHIYSLSPEEIPLKKEKMEELVKKWEEKLALLAEEFGLPLDMGDLRQLTGRLENDIGNMKQNIAKLPELLKDKQKTEEEITNIKREIDKIAENFREEIKDVYSREDWERLRTNLKRIRDQLEREEVEKKLQEAIGRLRAQEQKVATYRERAEELEKMAKEISSTLGEPPENLPSLEEINKNLDQRRAELIQCEKEEQELIKQILGDIPSLEKCREEYEKLDRELQIRTLSVNILEQARQNMTRKILPRTESYMWSILPLITNDRYRQVELDPDTYRIKVYDERAGDWKEKHIFSGGTRDQMSLALRLAFALATLPKERGIAPRFLFLDEPLSSFDEQRKEALIKVITEGEIADSFDQIFIISHTPLLNPNLFHFYIFMENGRIKECSEELLPAEKRNLTNTTLT
ncbi:SMC family ATPase [bacterium]|nr:SMC family ATPase [bacterium]